MKLNKPNLWQHKLPKLNSESNKYSRGHALVFGGNAEKSGAAKLAALSALRIGAGLVTIACEDAARFAYAPYLESIMLKIIDSDFSKFLDDKRITACVIGCGNGLNQATKDNVLLALEHHKNLVIDADAISVFKDNADELFSAIKASKGQAILTPHAGEFGRIFDIEGEKVEKAKQSAEKSGAIILLKGAKTIIAKPSGEYIINDNAPPTLATAGTGDVLAGIIGGLLAQKMPCFEAACAATWIHAEAANKLGKGMISQDLPLAIAEVLNELTTN